MASLDHLPLPPSSPFLILIISITIFAATAEKTTHLHFFMHDTLSGPNATAKMIVPNNPYNASLFTFGVVAAIDDPLTEGPNLTSKLVGRAQGLYAFTSLKGANLLWTVNLLFVEGKFNGSTLAVLATDDIFATVRELPVVGGTGRFRLARGYGLLKTYSFNLTSGDAILELDVYVMHP